MDQKNKSVMSPAEELELEIDQEWIICDATGPLLALLNYRPEELFGNSLLSLFAPSSRYYSSSTIPILLSQRGKHATPYILRDKRGENHTVRFSLLTPQAEDRYRLIVHLEFGGANTTATLPPPSHRPLPPTWVETIDGVFWKMHPQTLRFLDISRQASEMLGYPREDWLQPGFWQKLLHPDDIDNVVMSRRQRSSYHHSHETVYRLRHKNGSWVWVRDRCSWIAPADEDAFLGGIMVDISAQKRIDHLHRGDEHSFEILADLELEIATLELEPLLEKILLFLQKRLEINDLHILFPLEENHGSYRIFSATNDHRFTDCPEVDLGDKVHSTFFDQGSSLYHNDLRLAYRSPFDAQRLQAGVLSSFDIPLRIDNKTLAILACGAQQSGGIASETRWLISLLAPRLAQAIQNALLLRAHQESEQRLQERERELHRLSHEFQTLLDHIPDAILHLSPSLEVLWANRSATQLLDIHFSTPHKENFCMLWCQQRFPCSNCPFMRSLTSGQAENSQLQEKGQRVWNIRTLPLQPDERHPNDTLVLLEDITQKTRLHEESTRSAHLASIGELAAGVAHEINNPITGIINYGQMLHDLYRDGDQEWEISSRIIREGERISLIVRNLLNFSRPGRGSFLPIQLQEALEAVLSISGAQLRKESILLELEILPELPPIMGDSQQLQQVLLNLLHNARHALSQKFPRGSHPEKRLSITAKCLQGHDNWLRVSVKDQGIGIPESLQSRVLEPFFTTKPQGVGTGLGLAICRDIITAHGGQLHLESREGEFTRFDIDLPVASKEVLP